MAKFRIETSAGPKDIEADRMEMGGMEYLVLWEKDLVIAMFPTGHWHSVLRLPEENAPS